MAETGHVYVPNSCTTVRCRLHVALHGCLQDAGTIGQAYLLHAGYNEWADTNAIIVLYPQTTATNLNAPLVIDDPTAPINPKGCWDWWGYTDSDYATRQGEQISAIKAMVDRLTSREAQGKAPVGTGPAGMQVIDASDTAIDLVWSPVAGASAYDVYRKASGGDFAVVGTVGGASFGDSGLLPATTYSYAVSVSGAGTPDSSAAVSATTRSRAPRCDDTGHCPVQ